MKRLLAVAVLIFAAGCGTIPTPDWFPPPDRPDGPKTAVVDQKVKFKTQGTDPANVHEFQWNFGDSSQSDWDSDNETIKYKFPRPGTFEVKVRERCPLKLFQSDWSDPKTIIIMEQAK